MHPTLIISAYRQALEEAVNILQDQIRYLIQTSTCEICLANSYVILEAPLLISMTGASCYPLLSPAWEPSSLTDGPTKPVKLLLTQLLL